MDKIVSRVFELKEDVQGSRVLIMYSRKEGEFGTVLCTCSCELNGELFAARVADQGEPDGGFAFRLHEIHYFVSYILPLFNPLNHLLDEVSFPSPAQPENQ